LEDIANAFCTVRQRLYGKYEGKTLWLSEEPLVLNELFRPSDRVPFSDVEKDFGVNI
jgi:hypothetical protein